MDNWQVVMAVIPPRMHTETIPERHFVPWIEVSVYQLWLHEIPIISRGFTNQKGEPRVLSLGNHLRVCFVKILKQQWRNCACWQTVPLCWEIESFVTHLLCLGNASVRGQNKLWTNWAIQRESASLKLYQEHVEDKVSCSTWSRESSRVELCWSASDTTT